MTEGARILQPLICYTLAGGKSITVMFLPGARIKGGQEYYGTPGPATSFYKKKTKCERPNYLFRTYVKKFDFCETLND